MSTCKRLDLESLGSRLTMPKNFLGTVWSNAQLTRNRARQETVNDCRVRYLIFTLTEKVKESGWVECCGGDPSLSHQSVQTCRQHSSVSLICLLSNFVCVLPGGWIVLQKLGNLSTCGGFVTKIGS